MGHRALVAYDLPETVAVGYSHWGARDLQLRDRISVARPFGGGSVNAPDRVREHAVTCHYRQGNDGDPRALEAESGDRGGSFEADSLTAVVDDRLDFLWHEAFYVVRASLDRPWSVAAYRTLWTDFLPVEDSPAPDRYEGDHPYDWYRPTTVGEGLLYDPTGEAGDPGGDSGDAAGADGADRADDADAGHADGDDHHGAGGDDRPPIGERSHDGDRGRRGDRFLSWFRTVRWDVLSPAVDAGLLHPARARAYLTWLVAACDDRFDDRVPAISPRRIGGDPPRRID